MDFRPGAELRIPQQEDLLRNGDRGAGYMALIGFAGALGVLGTLAALGLFEPVRTPSLVPEPAPSPAPWEAMFVDLGPTSLAADRAQPPG